MSDRLASAESVTVTSEPVNPSVDGATPTDGVTASETSEKKQNENTDNKDKINRPPLDEGRMAVIGNISRAVADGDLFRKVELGDPRPTEEDIRRVILPFDNLRRRMGARLRAAIARLIANVAARKMAGRVELVGLENLAAVKGGVIMTSNHYAPVDSLPPRLAVLRSGRRRMNVVVQEGNIFMTGFFGFLMRNANTLPVSKNLSYMARNLKPAIGELLARGELILIYPEAEMWFNYKKPREYMDGAYYYAVEFDKPIIPCFTTFREGEGYDKGGVRNLIYTLHLMPPIYPDATLDKRARRDKMREADRAAKLAAYERAYGYPPPDGFDPSRDIAGLSDYSSVTD